ncbi:MAG: hypothetical protein WD098_00780, partial [Balneolales bacterium]
MILNIIDKHLLAECRTMVATIMGIFMVYSVNTEALAQQNHMHEDQSVSIEGDIGEVNFRVSCDEEAQEDFDYALGMLHHMMYETARLTFEEITEKDPQCAMGYWGIATTLFQPLWSTRPSEEDLQKGSNMINEARRLVDSEREELLIEATAEFFREPETADFHNRLQRWAHAMEVAYDEYPDDHDVAALYGLTRLSNAQFAENRDPLHDEAETVLRNVFLFCAMHDPYFKFAYSIVW